MNQDKTQIRKRRKARKLALQAIYQYEIAKTEPSIIEAEFRLFNDMSKVDDLYFCRLLQGVTANLSDIDALFSPLIDRAVRELTLVELAILRLSTFELKDAIEVPYRIILDESVNLAREFGTVDGYRYVNGVLHQLALTLRSIEIKMKHE